MFRRCIWRELVLDNKLGAQSKIFSRERWEWQPNNQLEIHLDSICSTYFEADCLKSNSAVITSQRTSGLQTWLYNFKDHKMLNSQHAKSLLDTMGRDSMLQLWCGSDEPSSCCPPVQKNSTTALWVLSRLCPKEMKNVLWQCTINQARDNKNK